MTLDLALAVGCTGARQRLGLGYLRLGHLGLGYLGLGHYVHGFISIYTHESHLSTSDVLKDVELIIRLRVGNNIVGLGRW